ncbi:fibrous sheath-interacting protein 2-like [Gopherus evgoodei]|uniref:fibrous sheath-interacting protein 2-like n=1 Tax=Gopherus evgoodei TaxID=1825980 RepID=UPI0011CFD042|nr:fibrous sheath-interacting protein 2-like [Gopherus evgoodei]
MGAMSEFPTKTFKTEKFPFSQTYFKRESATKDTKPKKGLIGEDIFSDLNQDLPKGGIFKKVFDKQTVTDANDNDNLKMLQVAENVVKEVFRRVKDLSASVSILKKAPIELSERLFCSSFKRTEFPETFHKEFQKEIGLVAKEIVATVFDNFHKCLVSSIAMASDQEPVIRRKDQVPARRTSRISKTEKNKIMQAELPAYDPTVSSFTIDKIAKETVESVVFTLESFVAFQFKHDFKCKFSEIVKLPVENISSAQQTPFLSKRTLPTLEQFQSSSDVSRVSSMITKESIESAIIQVQGLHSELNIYATIAVNDVLEIFKRKLEKEISQRQTIPLYDDSEENIMAGEIISTVLDRCAQPQTEITLELKSGTLDMEKSGRTFGNNKIHGQGVAVSEGIKLPARKLREIDPRENFPPINVPGMVIYSEEETEMEEEIPSRLCPTIHKFSERDAHTPSEVTKKSMYYMSAPTARPSRPSLGTITKQRAISSRMTLPPIEPIEKLNETYICHSGLELPELRKGSISKSSMLSTGTESDIEKRRERRSSVNAFGRLDIKPKDVVCRNSFQNLKKPDVTRVELLKDVKSKEELISRLVSYDIQHGEDEDFEQIVKVDSTSVFESQEYAAVEQEIMPAYESAPLADMWNNLIAVQAPEKADQYKVSGIMEETTLTNLAGPKLDIDLLSAVSKGIPCLSESEVPDTQDKDPYVNMSHAQDTEDTLRTPEFALSYEDAGNKGSSLREKTGDADVSEFSTPSPGASVPEKVPGVLSAVFSQSCSSTSDISLPTPAAP